MKILYTLIFTILIYYNTNAQNVSGIVLNNNEQPISGATVTLLNTNNSCTTYKNGLFVFKHLQAGQYVLEVSNIGYATITKIIHANNTSQFFKFKLSEANKQLDEVIVKAQKMQEPLQQIPLSVTSLSSQQVEDYRLWNLKDLTGIIPNLYSSNPGDNRNIISLRGIATTSYDPTVATYIDGVNQFGLDTYIPQLFDIEQIEVLRGPQGTLYGRNAMGGVINITTKQPLNKTDGFAEINAGNYGQQRYSLGLRIPLVRDKLFLGAAGLYNAFNGFYINEFNNTRLDRQHSILGNYYLKYLPSNKWDITLNVKNYANRNYGPFALSVSPDDALANPFRVNQNATTKMIDNILNASLAINYNRDGINVASISTYQKNYRYYTLPIDGDFSPLDAVTLVNNYGNKFNKVEVVTQEFKFSSPSQLSNIKWVAGIYGFYKYSPSKTGSHFGEDAAVVGSSLTDFTSINTNVEHNYGTAGYGQLTYSIHPKWEITAGLRYDYEHKKEQVKGEFQPDGQEAMLTQADTSSKAGFKAFSPKLSVLYLVTQNNNIFAAFSRGFRAGGISQLSADPSQPPLFAYQPEYSNNFEIGSKNLFFNKKLRLNLSLFYIKVNNAQVPTLILPEAITVTKNAGKLNSYGAETEMEAKVLKNLDIGYSFGYTHARYQELTISSNGEMLSLKGNQQIYTPATTSMLAIQYTLAINSIQQYKIITRAEWRAIGTQYFDLANNIEQKGYSVYNARLGLKTKIAGLYIWGSNLFNKRYIDYAYDFGASHLGAPRTYGITLRKDF
jgi:iron complex outermembrane receptor protein